MMSRKILLGLIGLMVMSGVLLAEGELKMLAHIFGSSYERACIIRTELTHAIRYGELPWKHGINEAHTRVRLHSIASLCSEFVNEIQQQKANSVYWQDSVQRLLENIFTEERLNEISLTAIMCKNAAERLDPNRLLQSLVMASGALTTLFCRGFAPIYGSGVDTSISGFVSHGGGVQQSEEVDGILAALAEICNLEQGCRDCSRGRELNMGQLEHIASRLEGLQAQLAVFVGNNPDFALRDDVQRVHGWIADYASTMRSRLVDGGRAGGEMEAIVQTAKFAAGVCVHLAEIFNARARQEENEDRRAQLKNLGTAFLVGGAALCGGVWVAGYFGVSSITVGSLSQRVWALASEALGFIG